MEPHQPTGLQRGARLGEDEVVDRFVDQVLVAALHGQGPGVAVVDRQPAAEVVDDRQPAVLVDHVARSHERGPHRAKAPEIGVRVLREHADLRRGSRLRLQEPGEVETHLLDHLGPAVQPRAESVDVEIDTRGRRPSVEIGGRWKA